MQRYQNSASTITLTQTSNTVLSLSHAVNQINAITLSGCMPVQLTNTTTTPSNKYNYFDTNVDKGSSIDYQDDIQLQVPSVSCPLPDDLAV